jgi:hypothetical protein
MEVPFSTDTDFLGVQQELHAATVRRILNRNGPRLLQRDQGLPGGVGVAGRRRALGPAAAHSLLGEQPHDRLVDVRLWGACPLQAEQLKGSIFETSR